MITENLRKAFGSEYQLSPSHDPHKVVYSLEKCRKVKELLKLYADTELKEEYAVELWSPPSREGFFLQANYDEIKKQFEIMYKYPSDKIRKRDYYNLLSVDALSTIPINDEHISKVDFYYKEKIEWEFFPSPWKHPEFKFIVSDAYNSDRYGTCGVYSEKSPFWFRILDNSNNGTEYTIKYDAITKDFMLITPSKNVSFGFIFDNGIWKYFLGGEVFETIDLLIDSSYADCDFTA